MSKRMISIMDDDSICKMFVRKQFESSEYKTETNESDNDSLAFESLMSNLSQSEFLPYVIFLNIFMPKMTGWQFLEKLEPFSRSIANIPQIHVPSRSHINDFAKKNRGPPSGNWLYLNQLSLGRYRELFMKYYLLTR